MKWALTILFAAAALTVLVSLFAGSRQRGQGAVNVVGSTSIQPFAEMLAQEFHRRQPQYHVEVQGGGSTAGIEAVRSGIADIGTCSRSLKADEEFEAITIARDGLAIVAHRSNPVSGLSTGQIRGIFSGRITNWRDVGGRDLKINTISREEGSGTREAFMKLVMGGQRISRNALTQESNGAVRELVRNDPGGIGYMSLGLVGGEAKILTVDGVAPDTASVTDKRYPLVRPFLFVLKGAPGEAAEKFIAFVLSDDGQRMLEKEGLVRAR